MTSWWLSEAGLATSQTAELQLGLSETRQRVVYGREHMSLESREEKITELKTPIDAMYLIHKALRAEAKEAERMVYEMDMGESLLSFRAIFN